MSEVLVSDSALRSCLSSTHPPLDEDTVEYLASSALSVLQECTNRTAMEAQLKENIVPFLEEAGVSDGAHVIEAIMALAYPEVAGGGLDSHDQASRVVHIENFLLAYLGQPLLQGATMSLSRGRAYGLVGKNGVGKTTLLTKMSLNDIPGFPKNVRCTYVAHEVVPEVEGQTARDFCGGADPEEALQGHLTNEAVGFTKQSMLTPVADLSGGWRMRLALARATQGDSASRTDVLLLDEPTNHLDPSAVDWLVGYLVEKRDSFAVVIVSHDPAFMDRVCTDIIHYHNLKLSYYPGNFSDFCAKKPDDAAIVVNDRNKPGQFALVFNFPHPGRLDGIKINSNKSIVRMKDIVFRYPGTSKVVLKGVSCRITLNSRVCLIGKNGAGKSTLLNILNGDLPLPGPECGSVWKHHNLRISYIAQHHVHHLKEFLDKSPVEYFMARFRAGVDREVLGTDAMQASGYEKSEQEILAKKNGKRGRQVESLLGRRKDGKELWYEVKWVDLSPEDNEWVSKSFLEEKLGLRKLVSAFDSVVAQRQAGVDQRPVVSEEIIKHLADFGLAKHFALGKVAGLSGGQKSRLTLAAGMWTKPHLVILDEPTNYLDLDALDALADGVSSFKGAVILVSHNHRFVDKIARETWELCDGVLTAVSKAGAETEEEAGEDDLETQADE